MNAFLLAENVNKEMLGLLIRLQKFQVELLEHEEAEGIKNLSHKNELLFNFFEDVVKDKNNLE